MSYTARIVVVGNGIIGTATAWQSAARLPDAAVTLIGPSRREGGASPAAGAMLGHFGEITKYSFATEPARQKFALGVQARERWPETLAYLDETEPLRPLQVAASTFVVLNGRSGQLDSDNFAALLAALRAHGEPFDEVEAVPGLRPVPDARPLRALHLPHEGAIDGPRTLAAMDRAARTAGVTAIDDEVASIATRGGRVTGVRLADGATIDADAVVVAAGAFSGPLLASAMGPHAVLPILAGSGVSLVTRRVMGLGFDAVVRSVNRAGSCGLHVVPLGEGREYLGATNVIFKEPETQPHLGVLHFLMTSAMEQLDQHLTYSRIDEHRVGNRPVTLDTFPVLGPTSIDGLHVLSGTYRDGLALSPVLSDLIVRTIETGRSAFPDAFDPHRTPHLYGAAKDCIDEFVLHAISSAFEAGTRLSPFVDSVELEQIFRPRAEAVFNILGLDQALPPDIVTYLTLSRKQMEDVSDVRRFLVARRMVTNAA